MSAGGTVPVPLGCRCAGRRVPVHVAKGLLRLLERAGTPADFLINTYRCPECGITVQVTFGAVWRIRPAA